MNIETKKKVNKAILWLIVACFSMGITFSFVIGYALANQTILDSILIKALGIFLQVPLMFILVMSTYEYFKNKFKGDL